MPKKIIHILGTIAVGGAEIALYQILKHRRDDRFVQKIYYTQEYGDNLVPFHEIGVETHCLHWRSERDLRALGKLIRIFKKENPDIVNTHIWTGNYLVIAAARIAGVPVVIETIHGKFRNTRSGRLYHSVCRRLFEPFTDRIVAVSDTVADFLHDSYGNRREKMTTIHLGITDDVPVNAEKVQELRTEYGLTGRRPVLLTLARLVPEIKGFEALLQSIRIAVRDKRLDFTTFIVGDVQHGYPDYPAELSRMIEKYGLEEYVRLVTDSTNKNEFYALCDLFVMPSLYEGGPLTVPEAMQAGKPVIATRTGAVPAYITDGENGFITEPGDPAALADTIERALSQKDSWPEMGRKGRERFLNEFTIGKTVEKLTGMYSTLLTGEPLG